MDRDQAHRQLELLNRIADALEKGNTTKAVELSGERNKELTAKGILDVVGKITDDYASKHPVDKLQDIPGFEGTKDALDNLTSDFHKENTDCPCSSCGENPTTTFSNKELHEQKLHTDDGYQDDDEVHNDYLNDLVTEMTKEQYIAFCQEMSYVNYDLKVVQHSLYELEYEECLGAIKSAINILDTKDPYTYDNNLREYLNGVVNDEDNNIRSAAYSYEAALDSETQLTTKKDCILDYVTNEFGILGARYTDIIKFAYYLGEPNTLKYSNENRGYYSCAFNTRFGGHLIKGGKDQLVKGINNEGDERYFSLDFVESATAYWKRIA